MTAASSHSAESEVEPRALLTSSPVLKTHLLANALLITAIALCHPYSPHDIHWIDSIFERFAGQHQVFLEALLLLLPPFVLTSLIARWKPKVGLATGVGLISLMPVLYVLESVTWLTMRTHLFSEKTYRLIECCLPWIDVYTQQTDFGPLLLATVAFLAFQVCSVLLGFWIGRRRHSPGDKPTDKRFHPAVLLGGTLALMLLPLGPRLMEPEQILEVILKTPDRHPLATTGLFVRDASGDPEFVSAQETRVAAHLVSLEPAIAEFEKDYDELKIVSPPKRKPDVLVILAESLRHDALKAKAAPNFTRLAERSLTSSLHFSAGNASELGFFALCFGLDPVFFSHSIRRSESALSRLMRQAGYHTAFLGHGDLALNYIETFIHDEAFDEFSSKNGIPFYVRDEEIVANAKAMFERKGKWETLKDKPVFAFIFLFTTHHEYHYDPVHDEVFEPSPRFGVPTPPWTASDRQAVLNRYYNSVHCLDRIVAPLLTDDRIIVVLGDHGESFGDDQRLLHGTALSFTQTRTPLIVHVPGEAGRHLPDPTSHEDVLPTLLDALGMDVSTPSVLTGRSLLAKHDRNEELFSIRATVTGEHALLDYRSEFDPGRIFRFKLNLWEPRFKVLDANNEHQQPVKWTSKQALELESKLVDWLDRRLRTNSGPAREQPLKVLTEALENGSERQVLMSLKVLNRMGMGASPAINSMSRHLTSPNIKIQKLSRALVRRLVNESP